MELASCIVVDADTYQCSASCTNGTEPVGYLYCSVTSASSSDTPIVTSAFGSPYCMQEDRGAEIVEVEVLWFQLRFWYVELGDTQASTKLFQDALATVLNVSMDSVSNVSFTEFSAGPARRLQTYVGSPIVVGFEVVLAGNASSDVLNETVSRLLINVSAEQIAFKSMIEDSCGIRVTMMETVSAPRVRTDSIVLNKSSMSIAPDAQAAAKATQPDLSGDDGTGSASTMMIAIAVGCAFLVLFVCSFFIYAVTLRGRATKQKKLDNSLLLKDVRPREGVNTDGDSIGSSWEIYQDYGSAQSPAGAGDPSPFAEVSERAMTSVQQHFIVTPSKDRGAPDIMIPVEPNSPTTPEDGDYAIPLHDSPPAQDVQMKDSAMFKGLAVAKHLQPLSNSRRAHFANPAPPITPDVVQLYNVGGFNFENMLGDTQSRASSRQTVQFAMQTPRTSSRGSCSARGKRHEDWERQKRRSPFEAEFSEAGSDYIPSDGAAVFDIPSVSQRVPVYEDAHWSVPDDDEGILSTVPEPKDVDLPKRESTASTGCPEFSHPVRPSLTTVDRSMGSYDEVHDRSMGTVQVLRRPLPPPLVGNWDEAYENEFPDRPLSDAMWKFSPQSAVRSPQLGGRNGGFSGRL